MSAETSTISQDVELPANTERSPGPAVRHYMKSLEAVAPHGKIAKQNLEMEKYLSLYKPKVAARSIIKKPN